MALNKPYILYENMRRFGNHTSQNMNLIQLETGLISTHSWSYVKYEFAVVYTHTYGASLFLNTSDSFKPTSMNRRMHIGLLFEII